MDSQKPGQTVTPNTDKSEVDIQIDHSPKISDTSTKPAQPQKANPQPESSKSNVVAATPLPQSNNSPNPPANWQFNPDNNGTDAEVDTKETSATAPLSWTASEFIHHAKTTGWYLLLLLATLIVAGLVLLLTKDKISTSVIIIAGIVFGVYANRKPRTLEYKLDDSGLSIGNKVYNYDSFKSFAVLHEGAFSSVILLPLKRFAPLISLYLDPKDEKEIMNALADRLPLDEHRLDMLDQLMYKIRY